MKTSIIIEIKVKISLFDALKLRIAGMTNLTKDIKREFVDRLERADEYEISKNI